MHKMPAVVLSLVAGLVACDRGPTQGTAEANIPSRPQQRHVAVKYVPDRDWPRTEQQVARIHADREARGGPLTDEEVAKLEFAAQQGILSAYFDLYWHHSTDGAPSQAQRWFDEGVRRGEPNLLVILAGRQRAEAERMGAGPARTKLLREARSNFRAGLNRSRELTVASVSTVQEDISETDRLLVSSR